MCVPCIAGVVVCGVEVLELFPGQGQEWLAVPLRTRQSMCDPAGVYSAGAERTDAHYQTTQTHTRETEETVSLKTQINRNVVSGSIVTPIFNRRKEQMQ